MYCGGCGWAGANQAWRWAACSNSGQTHDLCAEEMGRVGVYAAVAQDILERHQQQPMHLMVGAGGQLCNNGVFKVPALQVCAAASAGCVTPEFQTHKSG